MATLSKISPCLWFDTEAEAAAALYTSIFDNSRMLHVVHYGAAGPRPEGMVMTVNFELDGQEFIALNGGPQFDFLLSVAMYQQRDRFGEDALWVRLTAGGEEGPCGWLKDQFGLSWQIVPSALFKMIQDRDPGKSKRVMEAMFQMKKIDIAEMERAYGGR